MARVDIRLEVGPRGVAAAAAVFVFAALVSEVSSESLNLTTVYPSPAGVYQSMLTAGMTYLSRDGRGVTVGSTQGVQGRGRLVVPSGSVGINTLDPSATLHVEGNQTFGNVTTDQPKGITWGTNPNAGYAGISNGTGFKYGITREPGGWAYPTYSSLKFEWIEGIKVRAHGGYLVNDGAANTYGGVTIWEDYCESGQTSCSTGGTGVGTEIARFRAQVYGGSYFKSRLGIGVTSPAAPLDVGRDGVGVFVQPRDSAQTPLNGGCPPNHVATTQSGIISASRGGLGFSLVCARCPDANCAGMP